MFELVNVCTGPDILVFSSSCPSTYFRASLAPLWKSVWEAVSYRIWLFEASVGFAVSGFAVVGLLLVWYFVSIVLLWVRTSYCQG